MAIRGRHRAPFGHRDHAFLTGLEPEFPASRTARLPSNTSCSIAAGTVIHLPFRLRPLSRPGCEGSACIAIGPFETVSGRGPNDKSGDECQPERPLTGTRPSGRRSKLLAGAGGSASGEGQDGARSRASVARRVGRSASPVNGHSGPTGKQPTAGGGMAPGLPAFARCPTKSGAGLVERAFPPSAGRHQRWHDPPPSIPSTAARLLRSSAV